MSKPPSPQRPPPIKLTVSPATGPTALRTRGRSGSLVKVEEVGARSADEILDQSAYANYNVEWVDRKGAWLIHPVLILTGKMLFDALPGMTQQISWTLTNLLYLALSYLMFHWVTGIPFQNEMHGGAYDELTLWEQIDEGAQYTPAKKWLLSVPIVLFLLSTHYTHYDPWMFAVNVTALVFVLIPKLPQLHRRRVHFMPETPMTPSYPPSGARTPSDGVYGVPKGPILDDAMFKKISATR